MTVSFIVVALNAEKTIKSLLEDLNNQTYPHKDIQLIFVDSLSTDKTLKILNNFKKDYENEYMSVSIKNNPKKILPCGWNIALKEVLGDVVLRVDAHSHIPEDFIEKNVEHIKNGEFITGGPRKSIIDKQSNWQDVLLFCETSLFGSGIAKYRNSETTQYVNTLAHAAYKTDVFRKVGGYDERLARTEDNEIHFRMREAGYKFLFSTDIKSFHHARSSLKKMVKQKFLNGKWIGLTMGVSPKCFSIYHFAPLAFVLAIIASIIFGLFVNWNLFIGILSLYGVANILMTLLSLKGNKLNSLYFLAPILFLILHLAYGTGTLLGILKMPFWKMKPENRECKEIENVKNVLNERLNNCQENGD